MNGDKFPDVGVIANDSQGVFAFKFQVLGNVANHRPGMYVAMLTDSCTGMDCNIAIYDGAISNFHIFANGDEGSDFHVFANLCAWVDHGKRIFFHYE